MKKWIKYGVLTLLVLALLGGVALMVGLDSAIRAGTREGIKFATQTETKLDKASLGLLSGNLKLSGLDIKNPQGFEAGSSFVKLGKSEVQVQPMSLVSDQIEVDVASIDGLEFSYVQPAEGKVNYEVIMASINRLLPAEDGSAPKEKPQGKQKAIHVGEIFFTGAKIHASVAQVAGITVPGAPVKVTVPLPDFKMENLQVTDGMPELTAKIIQELVVQVVKQAPAIGKAVAESAKSNVDVKGVTDAAKGIGDLFKKKK